MCVCVSHSVMSDSLQPHGLYSLLGSSVHGILQIRILELPFPTPGDLGLLHCRQILYQMSHQRSPIVYMYSSNYINLKNRQNQISIIYSS